MFRVILMLLATASPLACAGAAAAATFEAPILDPAAPGDGIQRGAVFDIGRLAQAGAAVEAMEKLFREQANYAAVLTYGARLAEALPADARLRGMRALALAATGALTEAETTLSGSAMGDSPWLDLAEAMIQRKRGALVAAAEAADRALSRDPANAYAHNLAGAIAVECGHAEAATARFAEAARLAPAAETYAVNLASMRAEAGDAAGASAALAPILRDAPSCGALTGAARIDLRLGRRDDARARLRSCLEADPGDVAARRGLFALLADDNDAPAARVLVEARPDAFVDPALALAIAALEAGDGATAEDELSRAAAGPRLERAFAAAMRGDAAAAQARAAAAPGAAARVAEAAFALAAGRPEQAAPPVGDALASRIAGYFSAGADPAAIPAAARAAEGAGDGFRFAGLSDDQIARLATSPGRADAALGGAYLLWGYDRPAAAALANAAAADPALAPAAYMLGVARLRLADRAGAADAFGTALAAAPGHLASNVALAELRLQSGDLAGAEPLLAAAAATAPDVGTLLRLGLVRETLGDADGALEAYEAGAKAAPDNYIALNQLAWHLASRGKDLARAETLARRADALQPGNASVLDTMGWIAFLNGDLEQARAMLARADAAAGGALPEIRHHQALVELAAGDAAAARRLLEPIVAAGPDAFPFSAEAADALEKARRLSDGG